MNCYVLFVVGLTGILIVAIVQRLVVTLIVYISTSIIGADMKVEPDSSWNLPPTPSQIRAIVRMSQRLGVREPLENTPTNRLEARRLVYDLKNALTRRHR